MSTGLFNSNLQIPTDFGRKTPVWPGSKRVLLCGNKCVVFADHTGNIETVFRPLKNPEKYFSDNVSELTYDKIENLTNRVKKWIYGILR